MLEKFTIELKCRFCGLKTGEHTVSSEFGWSEATATARNLGYVDTRCDAHNIEHGSYKDMEIFYEQEMRGTPQEFEDNVGNHPKFIDLIKAAAVKDIEIVIMSRHPRIAALKESLALDFEKKSKKERGDLIRKHFSI